MFILLSTSETGSKLVKRAVLEKYGIHSYPHIEIPSLSDLKDGAHNK